MRMVSYIPFGNIFMMTPCQECQEMVDFFDRRGGCQFTFFDKVTLASTAHELTTLATLISYKHNVAAIDNQWAVTTRIVNLKYPYIGLHTWCIIGYMQIVYWNDDLNYKIARGYKSSHVHSGFAASCCFVVGFLYLTRLSFQLGWHWMTSYSLFFLHYV